MEAPSLSILHWTRLTLAILNPHIISIYYLPTWFILPSDSTYLALKTSRWLFWSYPPFRLSKEEFLATCLQLSILLPSYLVGSLALTTQDGSQAFQASGFGCHSCQVKGQYHNIFSHMPMWLLAFFGGLTSRTALGDWVLRYRILYPQILGSQFTFRLISLECGKLNTL